VVEAAKFFASMRSDYVVVDDDGDTDTDDDDDDDDDLHQ